MHSAMVYVILKFHKWVNLINKFEKFVHVVGFIIRVYHDARPPELQICQCQTGKGNISL